MADDILKNALLNPKKIAADREKESEDAPDPRKGTDKGNLPGGFQMSQGQFSGYPKSGKQSGPPADMLRKHAKD